MPDEQDEWLAKMMEHADRSQRRLLTLLDLFTRLRTERPGLWLRIQAWRLGEEGMTMEHLKKEIHRVTDLLQVALSYGELGKADDCRKTLSDAVEAMTALLEHLAKEGIKLMSDMKPPIPKPPTGGREDEES